MNGSDCGGAAPSSTWRCQLRKLVRALVCILLPCLADPAAAGGLTYLAHEPAEKSAHPPLIVLMHGADADEHDMISLWHDLPQNFVVVSPRAPFADANGGFRWYRKDSRAADIAISRKIVDLLVDNAVKRFDADPARLFIGGFSQGGVMTYDIALHEPGRFRGGAVLSGLLVPSTLAGVTPTAAFAKEPLFVAHGTADTRIPFATTEAARKDLARLGVPVAFHAYEGLGHGTGDAETRDLAAWLSARAAPP